MIRSTSALVCLCLFATMPDSKGSDKVADCSAQLGQLTALYKAVHIEYTIESTKTPEKLGHDHKAYDSVEKAGKDLKLTTFDDKNKAILDTNPETEATLKKYLQFILLQPMKTAANVVLDESSNRFYFRTSGNALNPDGTEAVEKLTQGFCNGKIKVMIFDSNKQVTIDQATQEPSLTSGSWSDLAFNIYNERIWTYLPKYTWGQSPTNPNLYYAEFTITEPFTHKSQLRRQELVIDPQTLLPISFTSYTDGQIFYQKSFKFSQINGIYFPTDIKEDVYDFASFGSKQTYLTGSTHLAVTNASLFNSFPEAHFEASIPPGYNVYDNLTQQAYVSKSDH